MKKVLIVAYYFPPMGGVEVQRTLRFVKNLRNYDLEPVILTTQNGWHYEYDETLLRDIPPGVNVYRAKTHEYQFIKRDIILLRQNLSKYREKMNKKNIISKARRIIKYYIKKYILKPDEKNLWLFMGFLKGLQAIHEEKIDIIYASGYPWTCFLLGYFLKRMTKRPLVIDFRDPWMLHPMNAGNDKLDNFLEKKIIENADRVIFATKGFNRIYLKKYGNHNHRKFFTIRNGFEEEKFRDLGDRKSGDRFTITYTGSFTLSPLFDKKHRNPRYFLEAVQELIKEGKIREDKIKINLVGRMGDNIRYLVDKYGLQGIVKIIHNVTHKQALQYQRESNVLLLVMMDRPGSETFVPSKLYEYIASRRPVLATVTIGSEAGEIIKELNCGIVCKMDDVPEIKEAIMKLYRNEFFYDPNTNISMYGARNLTKMLVDQFNDIVKREA